jgi:hypothetical protein
MGYEERPATVRQRIFYFVIVWAVVGPLFYWLAFSIGWYVLVLVAALVWLTWDYVRKGEMLKSVDPKEDPIRKVDWYPDSHN